MSISEFGSVGDAASFTNCKTFGDAGAHLALQAAQQFATHNSRLNLLAESTFGAAAKRLLEPDPVEAAATVKILSGRESQGIAESLALAQQLVKLAQTTPPPTA